MIIYGKLCSGGMGGSENITPMTEKAVKVWAEAHLTADEYMDLFEVQE